MKFNTLNLTSSAIDSMLKYNKGLSTYEYEKLDEFNKVSIIGNNSDEAKAAIKFKIVFIKKDNIVLEDFKSYSYDHIFKLGLLEYIKLLSKDDSNYIKSSYSLKDINNMSKEEFIKLKKYLKFIYDNDSFVHTTSFFDELLRRNLENLEKLFLEDLNNNILSVARSIYKDNEIVNNLGIYVSISLEIYDI